MTRWGDRYTLEITGPVPSLSRQGPRVMALSAMGSIWGYLDLRQPYTQKQKQNKCIHNLRALCGILCVFVFSLRRQYMQVTYAPDEPQLYWLLKKKNEKQRSPIWASIGMVSLVYICGWDHIYIYTRDPRTCAILIPAWGSHWGSLGFFHNQNNHG